MTAIPVYLAGPDVFFPDVLDRAARLKALCATVGLEGLFPLDNVLPAQASQAATAMAIYRGNVALMDRAQAGIVNMMPWHGPSLDAGTAFEVGYLRAQGKPVFGYGPVNGSFADRVRIFTGAGPDAPADPDGMLIEDFGPHMSDNLMIVGAMDDGGTGLFADAASAIHAAVRALKG